MSYSKIIVDTPKGQYELPLWVVAENRTKYYSEKEGFEKESVDWNEEWEYVMGDSFEGIDWLLNNMDWDEVKEHAVKLNDKVLVTDDDFWTSSDHMELK